jgi:hypothetical protein
VLKSQAQFTIQPKQRRKTMIYSKGTLIAAAVAGLFGCASTSSSGSAPASPGTTAQVVQCAGINGCKGHGSCAGAENACKAQNSCKGKGWVETTSEDCQAKGGSVVAAK